MNDSEMSNDELIARKRLIQLCIEIANNYEDIAEEPIDFETAERSRNTPPWDDRQQDEDNEIYNADRRFCGGR